MAYDEGLAQRVEEVLDATTPFQAKKMFGGVGYMIQGNMACGVHKDSLIVRVGPEAYGAALAEPHTRPFDLTGRPMKGWVWVAAAGYEADEDLQQWISQGVDFALTLPAK